MSQPRQPFLHDLTTLVAAPSQIFCTIRGSIGATSGAVGVEGLWHADLRVLSTLAVTVDGQPGEHIATLPAPAGQAGGDGVVFSFLLRDVAGGRVADPSTPVRLDVERRLWPGRMTETMTITSWLGEPVTVRLSVTMARDLAPISVVMGGVAPPGPVAGDELLTWAAGDLEARLDAPDATVTALAEGVQLSWDLAVPSRGEISARWSVRVNDHNSVVVAAAGPPIDSPRVARELTERARGADHRLRPWLERSLTDLDGLRMATRESPDDTFFAAGSPWYLTLFGRDSLWTARMLLPVDPSYAMGTLGALAQLAGTTVDVDSAEQPGKIPHELRRAAVTLADMALPPLYYGTIDATPLWVCVLHDAWRSGATTDQVAELLPALEAALAWLVHSGDADGDGFLEYIDASGHGLTNQGWKDSADSVRFADGRIADGPVALCEVQGYAYEAATHGADLLEAFSRTGAADYRRWAANLAARFRAQFWCGDGPNRFPALALDGAKRRVDSLTSNIGHLLGTGLLDPDEERIVARALGGPALDSGYGLRTMSADDAGYSPLSYHCGSVWPHDTAIAILGLHRAGLDEYAAGLVEGLLRASVAFQQRLPELWSGEGQPVPYPAACRPQAWSAAAAVTVARVLAG